MTNPTHVAEDAGFWPEVDALLGVSAAAREAALAVAAEAKDLAMPQSAEEVERAGGTFRLLQSTIRQLDDARKLATNPILRQKADADAAFKLVTDALSGAAKTVNERINAYRDELERQRRAAVAQSVRDANRIKAQNEALAEKADAKGDHDKAAVYQERAVAATPAPVPTVSAPKIEGMYDRDTWKAEVVDASKLPREYLIPDQKALDGTAKALKERFAVPGARAVKSVTTVGKSL